MCIYIILTMCAIANDVQCVIIILTMCAVGNDVQCVYIILTMCAVGNDVQFCAQVVILLVSVSCPCHGRSVWPC